MVRGKRIRQNFKNRNHAEAERSSLEIMALQVASGLHHVGTTLTDAQVRQAESVFAKIKDMPRSLDFYVDYALANHKELDSQKLLSEAKEAYILQREDDEKKNRLAKITLGAIKCHMDKLVKMFPTLRVAELDVEKIIRFCEDGGVCAVTHNHRRTTLSKFLKFAIEKDWIATSPIDKVPRYGAAHGRGTAPTLTTEQAKKLMEHLETYENGKLVPFYALALFAGIRPYGEMYKLPIEAVNLENGVIHIDPKVSKVGMKRHITIQPNLAAWLKAYPLDKHPIIVPSLTKHRTAINKEFGLGHDILRHTFISMHVGKFRSMGDTALQAGNSESIIRKHYYAVKSRQESKDFFKIAPQKQDSLSEAVEVKPSKNSAKAVVPSLLELPSAA